MNAILGEKLGMTQIFDVNSRAIPVTVIKAGPCQVVQIKTPDTDGYSAVQLSFGETKPARLNKAEAGHLAKAGVVPSSSIVEIRVDDPGQYKLGQEFTVGDVFAEGGRADVTGVSKGKGFQGVMRRHGFSGQGAAHGTHKKHRAPGSIGACATPSRVFKGMPMAGRTGGERTTILNLEVVRVDSDRGLIVLGGAVPGPDGGLIVIREAVKGVG